MKVLHGKNLLYNKKDNYAEDFGNRLGAATELCLRYFHIRYKLSEQDKMTVIWFNRNNVQMVVQNESVKYYYSLPDLLCSSYKPDTSRPKYSKIFTRLLELLQTNQDEDKKAGIEPFVVMVSGPKVQTDSKKRRLSFQPKNGKTPQSAAEQMLVKITDFLYPKQQNVVNKTFLMVKLGHTGTDTKFKQYLVTSKNNIELVTEDLKPSNLTQKKTTTMSYDIRMMLAKLLQPFETMRIEENASISKNEGGLLLKSVVLSSAEGITTSLLYTRMSSLYALQFFAEQSNTLEREKLIKEVLETERTYVCSMSKILEMYYYPLTRQWTTLIPQKDKQSMFSGLIAIYELHKQFLFKLETRLMEWHTEQMLADIFTEMAPHFKIYTHYTTKYDSAIQTYTECSDKPAFKVFSEFRRKDPYAQSHTLNSFLIMPIQR